MVADERAAPSAARSPLAPRELSGLARTGDLARTAPSELSLLAGDSKGEGHSGRRRLFLSRLAERRLLGYSLEGWSEAHGVPKRKRLERLPRARGGPLVVCLDTSHSMAGGRETIAKAVVLEAVQAAHGQGRPCLLFAFSGKSDLAELRLTPPPRLRRRRRRGGAGGVVTDRASLTKLLDFLGCSFGGGTDVAGPLRRALDVLERPGQDELIYAGADVLLVSDGELPDPPLDPDTFRRLRGLQSRQGFEVHGLLVGKPRPTPLDQMCDEVHTCLSKFDPLAVMRERSAAREAAIEAAIPQWRRAAPLGASRARPSLMTAAPSESPVTRAVEAGSTSGDDALPLRERAAARAQSLLSEAWSAAASQPDVAAVVDSHVGVLRTAASALEAGLIEREGEARLLLLALVGGEHLLLLGPPGTAKSELCRRLSACAGLTYFERTLTRFSTPEELFGPLSLAALERDEFKRATAGYAPDAELVFIDEIFKSNSAILNTLLTLLNERLFDDGASRVGVPLLSAVAASNEGPESDELAALYDRFMLRKLVAPVSDDGVLKMLLGEPKAASADPGLAEEWTATGDERAERAEHQEDAGQLRGTLKAIHEAAPAVDLPHWSALLLRDARLYVRELGAEGIGSGYVSDRRLRRTAELFKSSAAAHGRSCVSVVDVLAVLPHVLWEEPEEAGSIADWVEANALPDAGMEQLNFLLSSIRSRAMAAAASSQGATEDHGLLDDAVALSKAAVEAATEMRMHTAALEGAHSHLFLPPQQAAALVQRLRPQAQASVEELNSIAAQAVALEMVIAQDGITESELLDLCGTEQAAQDDFSALGSDNDTGGASSTSSSPVFTREELQWGRKEAKSRLSAEDFKVWRKAAKKAAQQD